MFVVMWRARTRPFGYLIPEDLYIQVGARYLDQDPDRASSLGFA